MKDREFRFKSFGHIFEKERDDIKNNTVRRIDLNDERFQDLVAWSVEGWNDGELQIIIEKNDNPEDYFIRDIRDITIWNDLMVITWHPEKVIE
jgi:hypothetical protein